MTTFSFILPRPTPEDPPTLTEQTDLAARGVFYSLWQYLDKPKFIGFLTALMDALQPLESLAFNLYEGIRLNDAVGTQLDMLGKIVGADRGTKDDEEYRTFIRGKILANKSNCKIPEIYEILSLFDFDSQAINEYYPAAYVIEVTESIYPYEVYQLLSIAKPGGVALHFVYTTFTDNYVYQMSSLYPGEQYDDDKGAGGEPYAPKIGGRVTGVFV